MPLSDSAYEQEILDAVAEHGWFCTAVHDPDGREPDWAYSVGFTETLRQPEVIVFGLPVGTAHAILWDVFRTLQAGKVAEDGQVWPHLLVDHDCVLRRAHPSQIIREYLNSAIEAVVDRVSLDDHPLSKVAKDYASVAVGIAVVMSMVSWTLVLGPRVLGCWWN